MRIHEGGKIARDEDVHTIFCIEEFQMGPDDRETMVSEEIDVVLSGDEDPSDFPTWESLPTEITELFEAPDSIKWGQTMRVWF